MKIRKSFKFEASHIVRNCSSMRCKKNVHGHSYFVEVFLSSDKLDNGQMVYDFGLLKDTVGLFLDQFDHSWQYWDKENEDYKSFVNRTNDRWAQFPFSPSAENYAIFFHKVINEILKLNKFENGEGKVKCCGVRVHETKTGYAESEESDLEWHSYYNLRDIVFSPECINMLKKNEILSSIFELGKDK